MSLRNRFVLLFIGIIALTNFGCEKKLFNYRNKYVGDWYFTTNHQSASGGQFLIDTTYFKGSIQYDDSRKKLLVKYNEGEQVSVDINKSGYFTSVSTGSASGKFQSADQVLFSIKWGEGNTYELHTINGVKLKN